MSKVLDIEDKLDELKSRGLLYHEGIENNGRITTYTHYKKEKKIEIIFITGYGVNEERHKIEFSEHDMDIKIGLFSAPKKKESKFLSETTQAEFKEKNKNPLEMSDTTQDNFTGMRKHLFEAMRKIEGGTMRAEDAKSMAQLAQTIINSAKVEMEFKLLVSKQPDIKMIN